MRHERVGDPLPPTTPEVASLPNNLSEAIEQEEAKARAREQARIDKEMKEDEEAAKRQMKELKEQKTIEDMRAAHPLETGRHKRSRVISEEESVIPKAWDIKANQSTEKAVATRKKYPQGQDYTPEEKLARDEARAKKVAEQQEKELREKLALEAATVQVTPEVPAKDVAKDAVVEKPESKPESKPEPAPESKPEEESENPFQSIQKPARARGRKTAVTHTRNTRKPGAHKDPSKKLEREFTKEYPEASFANSESSENRMMHPEGSGVEQETSAGLINAEMNIEKGRPLRSFTGNAEDVSKKLKKHGPLIKDRSAEEPTDRPEDKPEEKPEDKKDFPNKIKNVNLGDGSLNTSETRSGPKKQEATKIINLETKLGIPPIPAPEKPGEKPEDKPDRKPPTTPPPPPRPVPVSSESPAAAIPPNTRPSAAAMEHAASLIGRPGPVRRFFSALGSPFRAIGRQFGKLNKTAEFNLDRMDDNVAMRWRNSRVDKFASKFESEKSAFELSKAKVINIEDQIKAIDVAKEENKEFIKPKDAARMEKARRTLEMQLISAQAEQDQRLQRVKLREGQTIHHENKRTEIARHYTELVDNHLRPRVEARNELESRKKQYQTEIEAWTAKTRAYDAKIKDLEERARKNPYIKSIFKSQIKDTRKMLAESQDEIRTRNNNLQAIDGRLVKVSATLQKWENNKATYSRMANRKIKQFDGSYIGAVNANDIEYRNPVEPGEAPEEHDLEQADARAESLERAPTEFSYDEWIKEWNSLNGSKLKLDADTMFAPDVVADYRRDSHAPLTADQFSGLVKVFVRTPEVEAIAKSHGFKSAEASKLVQQTLDSLRQKVADRTE